ncbi:TonB-dependent receptor [Novosphingobium sp.]|uniref:TonB-dependent receptor n=1 Tax=Novosphingobium sp. TaxID=1874826 RepID=UPI00286D828E|nr:TonB-dependent receptor [Novosphingobium sp.]
MRLYALLATTAAAALTAAPAFAQEAPATGNAEAETGLGEIIVTAQRRQESSQKAAIPLSVIDGAALAKAGVTEASRLNELAPALSIEPTSTGNLIFLRGVGNFTVVSTSDPAVAFNYDGVYIGRPTSTSGMFYDLERIEILKGPQGILYGRNATGGAINVLPVQPRLGEMSGRLSATYGSYDTINAEGALNLPMGENGALRVSAYTANHDGYLRDGTSDEESAGVRVQMKAELTPDLTVRVSGDYAHNGGAGSGVSYYGRYAYNPLVPLSATPVPGTNYYNFIPAGLPEGEGVYSPLSQTYRQSVTFAPTGRKLDSLAPYASANTSLYGAHAEITLKTGAGTLTVIPAWRFTDQDYVSDAAAFIFKNKESDEQYSLEARFAGERIGIFDYTLGAYFFDERIDNNTSITIGNTGNAFSQRLGTKSYAGFGRIVANLSDRLRLVGGLRYTKDNKSFKFAGIGAVINCLARIPPVVGAPACPTAPFIPLFDQTTQFAFPFPAAGGAPIPVFTSPGPPNYLIIRTDTTFNRTQSNSRMTYRGAVEFDLAAQSMLYASIETGYRSGGFAAAIGFETYNPEYITAYTVGMKNRFLDNRVQLNLEAFLWDYTDQQINHVGLDLNGRTANYTQNVGKSRIQGFEVEGRFLVTPTTLLSANVQYLDAKQKAFSYLAGPGTPPLTGCNVTYTAANASPYLVDCAGFTSYNSPKWTVNLAAQQTIPVGDFEFVANVDTQYKGARPIGFAYLPQQQLSANWTTNAQIQFGPADGGWSIAGFVRNIENNRIPIYSSTHPTAGFFINGTTPPRTYGVRASIKF